MTHPHFKSSNETYTKGHAVQTYLDYGAYFELHKLFPRRGHLQKLFAHVYENLRATCRQLNLQENGPDNERILLEHLRTNGLAASGAPANPLRGPASVSTAGASNRRHEAERTPRPRAKPARVPLIAAEARGEASK